MKGKFSINSELVISILAILIVGSIVFSSTKQSLLKAKEKRTRDQISSLQMALEGRIGKKTNLQDDLPLCNLPGTWCDVNEYFAANTTLDSSKSPTPILPAELVDSTGHYIKIRATGENSYLIVGQSAKNKSLCWIASSEKSVSNLEKTEPSACPE